MHPAFSVIFFTTASGAGYGLLALMSLLAALDRLPADRWFGLAGLGLGLVAVSVGLLSSTFHLGHPERAWRALSQWRSSWLSREGLIACITFVPAGLFALGWVLLGTHDGVWTALGLLTFLLSLATIACTAMIYASLRPIPTWSNGWTLPAYLMLGLMTGALWLNALALAFGLGTPLQAWIALGLILLAAAAKLGYWHHIDGAAPRSTAESATGLGGFGKVRLLEAPHSGENYLMREMGFRIARKHATKLRRLAVLLGFVLPLLLTLSLLILSSAVGVAVAFLAAISAMVGVFVERWLFFAQARHAVTLYYGTSEV
jgi:sulfite dehydrogenase (quinone) subunit SoeC